MSTGEAMARHALARQQSPDVKHACPRCMIVEPSMFCPVCTGTGLITTDQLAAYQRQLELEVRSL